MEWPSWQAFWDMGGYGRYVWWSFGVTAAIFLAELWSARRRHRVARNALRARSGR